jgi:hypothetical protein
MKVQNHSKFCSMIVSASYKTDIPAFYPAWFRRRLDAGFAKMVNPYGGQVYTVDLTAPACDGFIFWTKNAGPFRDALADVHARGFPFVVQYTITAYPRALETSVIQPERAIAQMRDLAEAYGPDAVVWRYDPVLFTSLTPPDWHRETVAKLAAALEGASDEVVFSVATIYKKTKRNTEAAAREHGFSWWDPPANEKTALLNDLAATAKRHGFAPTLCAQPDLLPEPMFTDLRPAACIDATRFSRVAGRDMTARRANGRPGCQCVQSKDIGAYDTCPHGCVYCYAVQRPEIAKRRYRDHDPDDAFLIRPSGRGANAPPR